MGEKRLEKTLALRPDLSTEVRWRPFQLRPEMPAGGLPWPEFAAEKFGSEANMRAAFDHVAQAGAEDGVRFDFGRIASAPNTVDAHRLILFARGLGLERRMADALFEAYFVGGKDLNNHDDLAKLAAGIGLDEGEVRAHLAGDEGTPEVWESQEEAARLGVTGVPFYVFHGRYGLSGAQPVEVFLRVLDAARAERVP